MHGKEFNHSIPYTKPIELPSKELPIDPYLLGCWLGDGASHKAGITSADTEIIESFSSFGTTYYSKYDYGITGNFLTLLKSNNLLGNKHVPTEYLMSSADQRLELLKGLMDTDGTINKSGNHCCFDNTNKDLADSVFYLVASLGMKPIRSQRMGKINGVEKKLCYRVMFSPLINPFKLERKRLKVKSLKKSQHHTIVSVEQVESVPMRCIAVSGESKLYLIGKSLIPTHNTELLLYYLYRLALTTPNGQFYYVAPFYNQASELIWKPNRIQNFLKHHSSKYIDDIHETDKRIILKNKSFIKLVGSDNYDAGRGYNPDGAGYDEFKDHDYRFHQGFVDNLMTKKAPLLIVGTPPETFDHFFVRTEEEFKVDPRGAYFKKPTHSNPYIDKEEIEMERAAAIAKGEWAKYMREIEAEIVPGGANAIFPMLEIPRYDEKGSFVGESRHVKYQQSLIEEIMRTRKDWDFYTLYDPGSVACFAAIFMAVNKFSKKVIILDEIYEKVKANMSTKQIYPRALVKMEKLIPTAVSDWREYYDYAATWFQNEVQAEYRRSIMPCTKDVNKKEEKLSVIKDFLLADLFVISDTCKGLISEMSTYATDENGKIPKINDHAIDCVRYGFNAAYLSTVPRDRHQRPMDKREWKEIDYMEDADIIEQPIDFYEEEENDYWAD